MIDKNGLNLLTRGKQNFTLNYHHGKTTTKLYSNSYAAELINTAKTDSDAIQIALSCVNNESIVNERFSPKRAERIFEENMQVVKLIKSIHTVLGLLLETELNKIEKPSPDDRKGYEKAIEAQRQIYREFEYAFQNAKILTMLYADLDCPLKEKPLKILKIDSRFLDDAFQELCFVNEEKTEENKVVLSKGYLFDSAANYLNYLLVRLVLLNPNICTCQNCGRLFLAKTNKQTNYCSSRQPGNKMKCCEIGPKNRMKLQSTLFGFEDYDKAVERNYQRSIRSVRHHLTAPHVNRNDYQVWLEKAQRAKQKWIKQEISDDEFLSVVYELDARDPD